ncbi:dTDP-4-dehydrorhamnose reductase [Thermoanaerobacterium thermosaccharolyticum]|uniref:dTDP-4-dehydrorhamnose reductase n=1 Tax=Thermoanaerobacterium thermosaccharolyticum TaxID=1517 RepID=UPI000C06D484|nr:dTDP-4-dehydrorhamnose reductase [Thermoanaerobacterium thermosaccharolyticum]PHO07901.1 dTDP-4-dehydrorhamnose reductase [Thermoanaerobacterium thermosaccharolyticum]
MKLLITGARGQLGMQLRSVLEKGKSELGKIDDIYSNADIKYVSHNDLDITNLNDVLDYVEQYKPDAIINCAAYTNVDKCESDTDNAFKVNAIGPRNLAIASHKVDAKLLHVSTDYVFNGEGSKPYKEYDIPNPVNVYGKTKLLGEQYVRDFCDKYFIVRTAWLYGKYGKNFVYTIINAAKERGYLEVVNDQRGNPTNAEDLAYHILKLILTNEYGIYHCTGNGECSWYDFACKIVEYVDIKCRVMSITSDKIKREAKRPSYSSLDNMMLRCTIGDKMRNWDDALKSFIDGLESK